MLRLMQKNYYRKPPPKGKALFTFSVAAGDPEEAGEDESYDMSAKVWDYKTKSWADIGVTYTGNGTASQNWPAVDLTSYIHYRVDHPCLSCEEGVFIIILTTQGNLGDKDVHFFYYPTEIPEGVIYAYFFDGEQGASPE
jgi:hypothetical protein